MKTPHSNIDSILRVSQCTAFTSSYGSQLRVSTDFVDTLHKLTHDISQAHCKPKKKIQSSHTNLENEIF